jgi:hypothetical protein
MRMASQARLLSPKKSVQDTVVTNYQDLVVVARERYR